MKKAGFEYGHPDEIEPDTPGMIELDGHGV